MPYWIGSSTHWNERRAEPSISSTSRWRLRFSLTRLQGKLIFSRDEGEQVEFATRAVARYLDTAHLRKVQHQYLRERVEAAVPLRAEVVRKKLLQMDQATARRPCPWTHSSGTSDSSGRSNVGCRGSIPCRQPPDSKQFDPRESRFPQDFHSLLGSFPQIGH